VARLQFPVINNARLARYSLALLVYAKAICIFMLAGAWGVIAQAESGAVSYTTLAQPKWRELSAAQKECLAPLASNWQTLTNKQRKKWLQVAKHYPGMRPQAKRRLHERMRRWAELSPQQRQAARDEYKKFKGLPPEKQRELIKQWGRYDQLTPEGKIWMRETPYSIQHQLNTKPKSK